MRLVERCASVLLLAVVAASSAAADDPPLTEAARRWQSLSPEEQRLALARFDKWKQLDTNEREAVGDRRDVLRRLRVEVTEQLPDDARERLGRMSSRQRKQFLKEHLRTYLEERRRQVLEQIGPAVTRTESPIPSVRRAIQARAIDAISRLEERGMLPEGEADRLGGLPDAELGSALRAVLRRAILQDPPSAFLALPVEDRDRILALDDDRFLDTMWKLRGRERPHMPRALEDALRGNTRPWRLPLSILEGFLTPEQARTVRAVPVAMRRREVDRALVANARQAMTDRGADPRELEKLKELSPTERELALLKVIDPEFDPDDLRDYHDVLRQRRDQRQEEMRRARDERRAGRRDPR